jgi:Pyruvate/2-oxoacid:ferredoxin oxidoreductase delta subunit
MGHTTSKSYHNLQKRLDMHAQGAPASDSLFEILKILFTEKEAEFVTVLPIRFFTVEEAAKRWKKSKEESIKILNTLADKAILFDIKKGNTYAYILAPTIAGFFEFSLMRLDGKFDKKILSELYYQYVNTEDNMMKSIFCLKFPVVRTFVHENAIQSKDRIEVLDYERASHIIKTASCIALGVCYCRHKMEHMGKACDNPQDVCMTFNKSAESLVRHKVVKKISKKEALKILDKCVKLGLAQLGDNVQDNVNFICNCCGCCCEGMLAYKKLGCRPKIHSNFLAGSDTEKCIACGACVKRCPVDAIKMKKGKKGKRFAEIDHCICIGCGVCTRFCPKKIIKMVRKENLTFVPKDSFEHWTLNAIEDGKLQNYIFDNYTLWTHDILRRLLGFILSLKPVKRRMAMRQMQSRFVKTLTKVSKYDIFSQMFNEGKKPDYSHPELKKK